jgi:UDP-4-amino-4,6-dideoxy-N-acetyl-beta-L-altrosamine transaminase
MVQANPRTGAWAALACHGGTPVRGRMLRYATHEVRPSDIDEVIRVLQSEWLTTGPVVEKFERAVAEAVGAADAAAVSSGTAALHAAVWVAGLGPGDEAIVSPMSFVAASNAVLYAGAKPVFVDVCDDTLIMDPEAVRRAVTPRTKAIIPTDYAGHPARLDDLLAIARDSGAVLIEDACHALGATWRNERVGSIADMTVFSFHPVKHITTGEGGMLTARDPRLARRARQFRAHGIDYQPAAAPDVGPWYYEMTDLGYNYRIPDINCALGLAQLRRLADILARRRNVVTYYERALRGRSDIRLPIELAAASSAWHLYPIRIQLSALQAGRREIVDALRAEGIGVQVHYIPVHWHPYYERRFGRSRGHCPVAEAAYEQLITLPLHPSMTEGDAADVATAVTKVLDAYSIAA